MKKIISIITIIALIMVLPMSVFAGTTRQDKAHDLADSARELGFAEDDPIILACQDIWWSENGKSRNGSYYYSSRTGKTYYASDYNSSENCNVADTDANGVCYKWNGNEWFMARNGKLFRVSKGQKIWATEKENEKILKNGTCISNNRYPELSGNGNGNNNSSSSSIYSKINYNGMITGVESYVNNSDALVLAKLIDSYCHNETSMTRQAMMGWCFLNSRGGNINTSAADIQAYFPKYNPGAKTTDAHGQDLTVLAKDLLFRYQAERNGIKNVWRVLPKEYSYYTMKTTTTASGVVTSEEIFFQASPNGAYYSMASKNTPYTS